MNEHADGCAVNRLPMGLGAQCTCGADWPRIYKVTSGNTSFWVLRLPAWFGWLRDRYNKLRYGFVP